jgi:hypothetical protein
MVTRETVIAFLLHQMPENARADLAERSLTDPEFHEQLRMLEAELLDAYVRDDVSPAHRQLIDQYLLASDAQRRKLAFARALQTALPSATPARRTTRSWTWLAAAATLIAVAGGWMLIDLQRVRPQRGASTAAGAGAVAQLARSGTSTGTIFIPAGTARGAAQMPVLHIPSDADVLRLDVELEPGDESQPLSARVTQHGRPVWGPEQIAVVRRGSLYVAALSIPVSALQAADAFDLELSARDTLVASYHARIERATP